MAEGLGVSITAVPGRDRSYSAIVSGGHPPLTYRWTLGGQASPAQNSDLYYVSGAVAAGTKLSVRVADGATPPATGTAEVELEAAGGDDDTPATTLITGTVWSKGLALSAALFLAVFYIVAVWTLWIALHDNLSTSPGSPPFAVVIAAGLLAVGLLALLGGLFLGLLEFRGKATAVDVLSRTPRRTKGPGGELSDSILGDSVKLDEVLKQFRLMSSHIAMLTIAGLCLAGAILIAWQAQRAAGPTTPSISTPSTPSSTPT